VVPDDHDDVLVEDFNVVGIRFNKGFPSSEVGNHNLRLHKVRDDLNPRVIVQVIGSKDE